MRRSENDLNGRGWSCWGEQGFFDRIEAANDAGVKAVDEDFSGAIEEAIDRAG
ncbi:MAG: hypothetical protein ACI8TQ_002272 [Planctomycetota bacterium]